MTEFTGIRSIYTCSGCGVDVFVHYTTKEQDAADAKTVGGATYIRGPLTPEGWREVVSKPLPVRLPGQFRFKDLAEAQAKAQGDVGFAMALAQEEAERQGHGINAALLPETFFICPSCQVFAKPRRVS